MAPQDRPISGGQRIACLVVAAGVGQRAGGAIPKQYQTIGGRPVLERTLRACLASPLIGQLLVVIDPDWRPEYDRVVAACPDPRLMDPVAGGASRQASVKAGLEALAADPPGVVLVHDAARPFVTPAVVDRVVAALARHPAAFPALPVVDTLWRSEDALAANATPRDNLWRAQTPQGFRYADLVAAHRGYGGAATDDVAVAQAAGLSVEIVLGDGNNFKITLPEDFDRAARLLESMMDIRTGQGFDVHAFARGDHVTLCGVDIPYEQGLAGHSDADVALHALTDAVFGALAEGDIGQWFPPSDAQWKGAASHIFLEKAMERAAARGFAVTHLDCTLICEQPKIGPHAEAMRASVAKIAGLDVGRVSVKATTSERLGFTGRGEGIAAIATATLVAG